MILQYFNVYYETNFVSTITYIVFLRFFTPKIESAKYIKKEINRKHK